MVSISCGILHTIANFISRRISVTTSYYSSIGKLMDNSTLAAKEFNIHFPPSCSCTIVSMLGKNTGTSLGHKWIKATEVNTYPFNTIFETSGNSIPIPEFENICFDIENQIGKLITKNFCDHKDHYRELCSHDRKNEKFGLHLQNASKVPGKKNKHVCQFTTRQKQTLSYYSIQVSFLAKNE